jgi:uridine phosphorylase
MEDSEFIVDFFLGCKPEDIAEYCVIVAFEDVLNRFEKFLNNAVRIGRTLKGSYDNVELSVIATGIGAPATSIYLEVLSKTKAKYVVRVGSAGGLQNHIKLDDIVIPIAAVRGEGTTSYYAPLEYPAVSDLNLVNIASRTCNALSYPYHIGTIVTTDALFRETKDFVKKWNTLGVIAVDMETSALYTVGPQLGLRVLSLLMISDNLISGVKFYHPQAHDELKHPAFDRVIKVALETIKNIHTSMK